VQGGRGVEPAGEGDADLLADGQRFENYGHAYENLKNSGQLSVISFVSGAARDINNPRILFFRG
jgi:hypothetical protein